MSAGGVIPEPQERHRDKVCGAPKEGGYRLHCELSAGHEPEWHQGTWHSRNEVTYLGSHHVVETIETVTWEPVDRVRQAVEHLMQDGDASPVETKRGG